MEVCGRYDYYQVCGLKNQASMIQDSIDDLVAKPDDKFQLNESKCKEMCISFVENKAEFAPIVIDGKAIQLMSSVKLHGLNISKDLKKVSTRLYFLK